MLTKPSRLLRPMKSPVAERPIISLLLLLLPSNLERTELKLIPSLVHIADTQYFSIPCKLLRHAK
jgi:hypothetical protein